MRDKCNVKFLLHTCCTEFPDAFEFRRQLLEIAILAFCTGRDASRAPFQDRARDDPAQNHPPPRPAQFAAYALQLHARYQSDSQRMRFTTQIVPKLLRPRVDCIPEVRVVADVAWLRMQYSRGLIICQTHMHVHADFECLPLWKRFAEVGQ